MTTVAERPRAKTRKPKTPPVDPATQYAMDVTAGAVVAGRAVRLACARHLSDLQRQRTEAFPYFYDVAAANHVIDFFPTFLTLEDGSPFVLPPWLQFSYGCIYGWKVFGGERHGLRKFQHGFFESSKGSGKALALDTPIITTAGWSTMGALKIGDRVFNERGEIVGVERVSDVMTGHVCYSVEFDQGDVIVADAEHLWFTEMQTESGTTVGVRTTEEIARTSNHSVPSLSGDRRILNVREVPSVPVRCIGVSGPSHLFLAGLGMIPTHNTPSAGGLAIYGAGYDDEPHAEIYSTGFDKGQASIILNDAIRMVNDSPDDDFKSEFIADKYNIAHHPSGSFVRAMPSQHQSKSGPRPHYVLSDEIHEHRDGTVVSKAESGFKNRKQPLGLKYTNAGSDKASYCWELHQKSVAILEGTVVDEQWFSYVCHLDPCARCFSEGYRQPKDGCSDCDDWTDPKVWPKIAPALGIVIQPKYLQDAIDTARSVPSQFALKRRLNFSIWTETHQVWIGADRWDACKVDQVGVAPASACTVGFDMSEKLDLTACVVARRVDDAPGVAADVVELVEVLDGKEIPKTLNLNFCVELIPFFWMPEDTMLDRIRTERYPFDVWKKGGHLRSTIGPIVDHDLIFEEFTKEIVPKYKPKIIGYDAHNATQFGAALRDRAKLNAVEVPQGRALSEAFKWFEALVQSKRIRHMGNPVLGWCVSNCEAKFDRYRNMWVEKPSATKRIDGAIAAVEALKLLMVMPPPPTYRVMVFGGKR